MSGVYFLYMKTKKGFTLVEVMIVCVIIGLLAAMAIPAFQKVKYSSIRSDIQAGVVVSEAQYKWYKEYRKENPRQVEAEKKPDNQNNVEAEKIDTIVINGKTYKLVPQ